MCYDISFTVDIKQLSDYFPDMVYDDQIKINFEFSAHIQGHAYGLHPIIYKHREDILPHIRLMEWGCIPYYVKDRNAFTKQRATMLNIRSERILDDPKSYWYKIREKRCLIPVTGFYEHQDAGLPKKVPYLIQLKQQPVFYIPGLYSVSKIKNENGELEEVWTLGLITREAIENRVMQQIHNSGSEEFRMPLLLPFELSEQWVRENLDEAAYRRILNFEMPGSELNFKTVYTIRSSKPRPDEKPKDEFYDWGPKVPAIVI